MLTDYRLNPASMFLVFMANQTQGVNNISLIVAYAVNNMSSGSTTCVERPRNASATLNGWVICISSDFSRPSLFPNEKKIAHKEDKRCLEYTISRI